MLYDNHKLLSPEGRLLALIDTKRAKWYVRKGLATFEPDSLAVRLKFCPTNSVDEKDDFNLIPRRNQCVVCGTTEDLTRHHVIPQSFRKYFDLKFKSRLSHDVLAVCRQCHNSYNVHETEFRNTLLERYNIPTKRPDKQIYISAAKTLLSHKLPTWREDELLELLIDFLGHWPEEEDLKRIATMEAPYLRDNFKSSGEYIVKTLSPVELNEFAKQWRAHFVETMNPKFLPVGWSPDRDFDL
jgi:hypothetical protein